jgi:hypothetical protein
MELDDFKQAWHNATDQLPEWSAEQLQNELMQKIRQHSQSIYKRILGESAVGIGFVLFAVWVLLQKNTPLNTFFAVLTFSAATFSIFPIVQGIRAWQAEKKMNFADNFLPAIRQQYNMLKNTFTVHLWATYLLCMVAILWTFLDTNFDKFLTLRIVLCLYFGLLILGAKLYLNWLYGSRIKQLAILIDELESINNETK